MALNRRKEPLVFWEKQSAGRLCALHCLNSLLQGPYFTESEMSSISADLDKKERQLIEGDGGSDAYQQFLTDGGGGNSASDGYFNITVLIECLGRKRLSCRPQMQATAQDINRDLDRNVDIGYILNLRDHWIGLRKVHGQWYNLDSIAPAPTLLDREELISKLLLLNSQGYSTFVVSAFVGDLPQPGTMQTRQNNQFYLTRREINELHEKAKQNASSAAGPTVESNSETTFSTFGQQTTTAHEWPSGEGYRLDGQGVRPASNAPQTAINEQDDPQLLEAIRRSLQICNNNDNNNNNSINSSPSVPTEPPPGVHTCSADTCPEQPCFKSQIYNISIRTASGAKISRRFYGNNTLLNVFDWIIVQSNTANQTVLPPGLNRFGPLSIVQAVTRIPFRLVGFEQIVSQPAAIKLLKEANITDMGDSVDVTRISLQELDIEKQELFLLAGTQ